jgi:hypothetical protein
MELTGVIRSFTGSVLKHTRFNLGTLVPYYTYLRRSTGRIYPPRRATDLTTDSKPVLEKEIRSRAYERYEERGREDGHDLDDWLRAEKELIEAAGKTAVKVSRL